MLLRVVRGPVLAIEQGIGHTRKRLVHADQVRPGGKGVYRRLGRLGSQRIHGCRRAAMRRQQARFVLVPCRGVVAWSHVDRCRLGKLRNLNVLLHKRAQQRKLAIAVRGVGCEHVGCRPRSRRLGYRAPGFDIEVFEKVLAVFREVRQGSQKSRLLVVVVIALGPEHACLRRILPVPGPAVLVRRQDATLRVGPGIAKGFIQAADAVVHAREKHEVARTPGVEVAMRKNARQSKRLHLPYIVPAQGRPLVGEQGIDPRVVGPVADRVVVEKWNRLM